MRQALAAVQSLTAPVVGADFVEFKPDADRSGVTAAVSAKLVKELAARMLVETR
ncbi:MAG: arginase family protein [Gemmatimonadales bacterium]